MYLIYFNCYFYRETKNYAPKWIKTDIEYDHRTPKRSISAFKENTKERHPREKTIYKDHEKSDK